MDFIIAILPLVLAWILDFLLGDPLWLPHPVIAFGKAISFFERKLNKGSHRILKGGFTAVFLILGSYAICLVLLKLIFPYVWVAVSVQAILIFFCLAGTTLIREVRMVFKEVDVSLEHGRRQVARIVGRDTASLSAQDIRTAALETLAENLSDGVIAPLFWYALLGVPGMVAYKMVNTLDSMLGYKSERYRQFGMVAARIDDAANY
ncbi:MAG: adenosylcobinamide-phosphate synthase CbiB, partial [Muribaculaceae bacterium]|nr:adenosylcobinamide-phosphate synthase CbiB [Muribaculaceae bacterium]